MLKKTISAFIMCSGIFMANSQDVNTHCVNIKPNRANGFVILDKAGNPDVTSWRIKVFEQIKNSEGEFELRLIERNDFTDYYLHLDEEFMTNNYFFEVEGLDGENNIISHEGPMNVADGQVNYESACTWNCVDERYAYTLNLLVNESNSESRITMYGATPQDGNNSYYYEWVSSSNWFDFVDTGYGPFYGLSQNPNNSGIGIPYQNYYLSSINEPRVVQLTNVELADGIKDFNGGNLQGTVWGISKSLGPWHPGERPGKSSIAAGDPNCGQAMPWAIAMVNTQKSSWDDSGSEPDLSCGNYSYPSHPAEDVVQEFGPCWMYINTNFSNGWAPSGWSDIMSFVGSGCSDLLDGDLTGSTAISWPAAIDQLQFISEGNPVITVTKDDLFYADGTPKTFKLTLNKGLYKVMYLMANKTFRQIYFDNEEEQTGITNQSDYLTATVYPVPLTGNAFQLELGAQAKLSFTYSLYDFQGNELYSKEYRMRPNEIKTALIEAESIPKGVLLNKFVFEDGSSTEFQTIK